MWARAGRRAEAYLDGTSSTPADSVFQKLRIPQSDPEDPAQGGVTLPLPEPIRLVGVANTYPLIEAVWLIPDGLLSPGSLQCA
jgi:hypothetical protein